MQTLIRFLVTSAVLIAALAPPAMAEDWPTRPVKIIIPYPPGGSTDIVGRPYAQELSQVLGQPFVLDHKAGATGAIGMEATARSAPDGYTFTITAAAATVAMPATRKLAYRPFDDFAPVGRISTLALVIAVHPSVQATTLKEFIAVAKSQPGKIHYGTAGIGATSHFSGEYLKQVTGIDIVNVPYRGSAEVQNDFLAGHVQVMLDGQILPHLKAGKGRLLAFIDEVRHPDFPDVPTIREIIPSWEIFIWFGMMAPAGTPRPIIERMSAALNEIARKEDMKARLWPVAQRPVTDTPEGFAETLKRDFALYSRLAKELDMKTE
ncbi:MAG: tripartite tricarboxylate transporter substrate binding protein [Alphaproteobacteria bacterium]|nr:tripartite tricarboxylate transporter substrate binding protein [Alphaproteobacteria bacterium]